MKGASAIYSNAPTGVERGYYRNVLSRFAKELSRYIMAFSTCAKTEVLRYTVFWRKCFLNDGTPMLEQIIAGKKRHFFFFFS